MLTRRGFTMIELLVSLVLLAIVGGATIRVMSSMMNSATAQVEIASAQGNARVAALGIPQELREIGWDTIPYPGGGITSDLESIGPRRLTFRAMRGMGMTCGTPTDLEFRIRTPVLGIRPPQLTDGFRLFVESDPNAAFDDQWVAMDVIDIDFASTCGADPAIRFTLGSKAIVDPNAGPPAELALSQIRVGGPIRWFERLEIGPYVDPVSNQAFVGMRSISAGELNLSPVIGPIADTTATLRFHYYSSNGGWLDPATTPPTAVRAMGIQLTTVSSRAVSLSGSSQRARKQLPIFTFVALRNTLRP